MFYSREYNEIEKNEMKEREIEKMNDGRTLIRYGEEKGGIRGYIELHEKEKEELDKMCDDHSIPHIIFYGKEGVGKKTVIDYYLERIYGKGINKLVEATYEINGSGNNTNKVKVKQSNYHIIIEPHNNNFDKHLIQNIVKEYAKRIPLNIEKRKYKVVYIKNLDNLSQLCQYSLRRTLEKYSDTCRFIMCCNILSKIIEPLKSRCLCYNIKSISNKKLTELILYEIYKKKIKIDYKKCKEIIKMANGSIKKVLLKLELYKETGKIYNSYEENIEKIWKLLKRKETENIITIREIIYEMMITNINTRNIVKDLTLKIIEDNISEKKKSKIIRLSSEIDVNLINARRHIIQLETLMINIIYILYNY